MAEPLLLTDRTGWGVRLTLNRPDKLNALSGELVEALSNAIDEAAADPDVRVIALAGSGRAFCSGYDLSEEAGGDIHGPVAWRDLLAADVAATLRVFDCASKRPCAPWSPGTGSKRLPARGPVSSEVCCES